MVLHEKKMDKLSKLTVGVNQIYNVFQPIETPLEIKKFYRGLRSDCCLPPRCLPCVCFGRICLSDQLLIPYFDP